MKLFQTGNPTQTDKFNKSGLQLCIYLEATCKLLPSRQFKSSFKMATLLKLTTSTSRFFFFLESRSRCMNTVKKREHNKTKVKRLLQFTPLSVSLFDGKAKALRTRPGLPVWINFTCFYLINSSIWLLKLI